MRYTRHLLKYINKYKCKLYQLIQIKSNFGFKMYTSKPPYVNYINHINKFKIN